jgi:hypothetical protein
MTLRTAGALALASVAIGCATNEGASAPPAAPAAPLPASAATETPSAPKHGPDPSGGWFRLEDLIGRKLDELDAATCADPKGFELASGLWVEERALAVRRCAKFLGPHAVVREAPGPALLTMISDGGRIVFAVATREYELEPSKRVAEELVKTLTLAGCQQAHSNEQSVGFIACPGGPGWAAVSWLALPEERGGGHAVVFEVAASRDVAESIARALAGAPRE